MREFCARLERNCTSRQISKDGRIFLTRRIIVFHEDDFAGRTNSLRSCLPYYEAFASPVRATEWMGVALVPNRTPFLVFSRTRVSAQLPHNQ